VLFHFLDESDDGQQEEVDDNAAVIAVVLLGPLRQIKEPGQ
jgi:hypothetical protein